MATSQQWGFEFLVHASAGSQTMPRITALKDGGFIAVYNAGSEDGMDSQICGQIFDAQGAKVGGEIVLNGNPDGYQNWPTVTALADGRFVVAWNDANIMARLFEADGTAVAGDFLVNDDWVDNAQNKPSVTALADGGFAIAYYDTNVSQGEYGEDIRVKIFDENGEARGPEFVANAVTSGHQDTPRLVGLTNGSFVLVYTDESEAAPSVRGRIISSNGTLGAEFMIPADPGASEIDPSVTVLKDGRFVVVWSDFDGFGNTYGIRAQVFTATGERSGEEIAVDGAMLDADGRPVVSALPDGGFAVAYANTIGGDADIWVATFDAAGAVAGATVVANTGTAGAQSVPAIATLADGRLVVTWQDSHAPVYTSAIRGQILDPTGQSGGGQTITGTEGDDPDLTGTEFADVIYGLGGNDRLDGGLGADALHGGKGDDIYVVNTPLDTIVELADEGRDRIVANTSYSLAGIQNVEELSISGAAAADLMGNALDNKLFGNMGANRIDGGIGADMMAGGEGADSFLVDNAFDQVVEHAGGGIDTVRVSAASYALSASAEVELLIAEAGALALTGSSGANTMIGNGSANILKAGAGHDKVFGGLGNDKLYGGSGRDIFVLDTKANRTKNLDKIVDYRTKDDTIWLDNAVFTKLGKGTPAKPTKLAKDAFWTGAKARDREDRIVYDKKTGSLYYDKDGTGGSAQVKIATLTNKTKLAYHDFYVI